MSERIVSKHKSSSIDYSVTILSRSKVLLSVIISSFIMLKINFFTLLQVKRKGERQMPMQ